MRGWSRELAHRPADAKGIADLFVFPRIPSSAGGQSPGLSIHIQPTNNSAVTKHHDLSMTLIERVLDAYGGLATTYELVGHGCDAETLRIFARFGHIIHVRRGWWGARDLSPQVVAARQAGGRLACVSALAHHGLLQRSDDVLHVSLDRHSRLLRRENTLAHWSRRHLDGDRQAVSARVAIEQARACRGSSTGTL